MAVKIPMSIDDQQEAFDLLASLIERHYDTGQFDSHQIWWYAEEFADKLREDMITRELYLNDWEPIEEED